MKKVKQKNTSFGFTPVYLVVLILFSAVALVFIISQIDRPDNLAYLNLKPISKKLTQNNTLKKFTSVDEFREYIEDMDQVAYYGMGMGVSRTLAQPTMMTDDAMDFALGNSESISKEIGIGGGGAPDRISDTNVQVAGIDEADIVKTDGSQIYFSDNIGRYWIDTPVRMDVTFEDDFEGTSLAPEFVNNNKTNIINAWPPSDLALSSEIDLTGDLLLADNILMVFSGQNIVAYDVSNPKEVTKKWDIKLDDDTYLVTSRLYNNKVYLVTQTSINRYNPCPITPFIRQGETMIVPCGDIYYPSVATQVNSTFTAIILDPKSGNLDNKISFVGDQNTSNIYMSKEALYIAYTQNVDMFDFMFDFVSTEMKDYIPANLLVRLNKLSTYDISSSSKFNELQTILDEWMQSLDKDQMLKLENDMQNRAENYYEKNKRLIVSTGIAKIDINNFKITANTSVPGYLLNQFSMDEFDGNLRVATTIGESWRWGISASDSQANDVYILDDNLKIQGSILDLGLSERIYAVRFIGDLGYLVTFRQTDPFYVLDLSSPKNPKMVGELKIPGYSSYLHPISENKILGIGMENGQVKLSYFDVSNPSNPQEIAKYSLAEYGSDVLYNHHAFLQDPNHEVFFLPSYNGGYIFSYANDNLELVRAISVPNVQRALYLGDYMYILADDYIAVLNETDWEKVNDLDL
ncbi:MAG: beta-propeller domain-containing protein [Patescibacteria group bacterium]|jgi:uncharacterized secreted protein with C-terminal beta-propeller domain